MENNGKRGTKNKIWGGKNKRKSIGSPKGEGSGKNERANHTSSLIKGEKKKRGGKKTFELEGKKLFGSLPVNTTDRKTFAKGRKGETGGGKKKREPRKKTRRWAGSQEGDSGRCQRLGNRKKTQKRKK